MVAMQRTVRHSRRRGMPVGPCRRVYVGGAVTRRASSRVFLSRTTQQMTSKAPLRNSLGAAAKLAAVAGWGTLLALLGA